MYYIHVAFVAAWLLSISRACMDVATAGWHGSTKLSIMSASISISMLAAVVQDTDLLVGYVACILLANMIHALLAVVAYAYTRYYACLAHMYLGYGLPAWLRILLGSIETASTSFRCVSLSLRTVCNAVSGHVLLAVLLEMTLLATYSLCTVLCWLSTCWVLPLVVLKLITCIIQGTVYHRLVCVYWDELRH
uniref:ATP synthase F0 subunit a n=1 Tax=Diplonema ambulator TaxID=182243 RepID=A0A2D2AJS5_9EUGL|nr:ATP synthase F0 subunit a [Diplonema ambulator]